MQVLREDHYYRAQDHLPMAEREKNNYDHPRAFEHELLVEHLQRLKQGDTIDYPSYCYKTHTRLKETETLHSAPVIIIEGIMLLASHELQPMYDIKIYVDTPLDICLLRRIKRDIAERGRTLDSVAGSVGKYGETHVPRVYRTESFCCGRHHYPRRRKPHCVGRAQIPHSTGADITLKKQ